MNVLKKLALCASLVALLSVPTFASFVNPTVSPVRNSNDYSATTIITNTSKSATQWIFVTRPNHATIPICVDINYITLADGSIDKVTLIPRSLYSPTSSPFRPAASNLSVYDIHCYRDYINYKLSGNGKDKDNCPTPEKYYGFNLQARISID